jgi:hypothetical protein
MAQRTIEELANDFTYSGTNPGGISDSILTSNGGGGGGRAPGGDILAFDPYTSPYITPRRIFFTINTYTNLSRTDVLAKAYLNGIEIEDQSNSKGRITFSLPEQRFLDPSVLTLVSGDLKPQKYFIIQSRRDVENEVSIIEYDITTDIPTVENAPVLTGIGFGGGDFNTRGGEFAGNEGVVTGGGGSGFGGGGGGMREVNPNDYRGAGFGLADVTQRENLQ